MNLFDRKTIIVVAVLVILSVVFAVITVLNLISTGNKTSEDASVSDIEVEYGKVIYLGTHEAIASLGCDSILPGTFVDTVQETVNVSGEYDVVNNLEEIGYSSSTPLSCSYTTIEDPFTFLTINFRSFTLESVESYGGSENISVISSQDAVELDAETTSLNSNLILNTYGDEYTCTMRYYYQSTIFQHLELYFGDTDCETLSTIQTQINTQVQSLITKIENN